MGNVSDSVVGYAHCPVLIVRNKGTITREAEVYLLRSRCLARRSTVPSRLRMP